MTHGTHGGEYNVDGPLTSQVINRVINRPPRHTQDNMVCISQGSQDVY